MPEILWREPVVPTGRYPLTLIGAEAVAAGAAGAVDVAFVVDSTDFVGTRLTHRLWWGGRGRGSLRRLCDALGIPMRSPALESPRSAVGHIEGALRGGTLRVEAAVRTRFDVKKADGTWARDVAERHLPAAQARGLEMAKREEISEPWEAPRAPAEVAFEPMIRATPARGRPTRIEVVDDPGGPF